MLTLKDVLTRLRTDISATVHVHGRVVADKLPSSSPRRRVNESEECVIRTERRRTAGKRRRGELTTKFCHTAVVYAGWSGPGRTPPTQHTTCHASDAAEQLHSALLVSNALCLLTHIPITRVAKRARPQPSIT